jgi:MFS transporter, DHA1 family, multidrug resistance protein
MTRTARSQLIVLLGGLSAFAPLSMDLYLPGLPAIQRDLSTGPSQVQLTLTSCMIGLALGQVLAGPISDAFGRRRPLMIGIGIFTAVSLLCAAVSSVYVLTGLRLVQGLAGASAIVISRAVVRDMYAGVRAARFYSILMLVSGVAIILAPLIGAQLLQITSWQGLFVALAAIGFAALAGTVAWLPETLPPERRRRGGLPDTVRTMLFLLHQRVFVGYTLALGLTFGALSAYIAASPFVFQNINGLSPQLYSAFFAANALGLVILGQANGLLVGRIGPHKLLVAGLAGTALASVALLAIVSTGSFGLAGMAVPLFVQVSCNGLIFPNLTALAMTDHPEVAGSASALIGVVQFLLGAAAAPLAGLAGSSSALPMAITIAVFGLGGCLAFIALAESHLRTA